MIILITWCFPVILPFPVMEGKADTRRLGCSDEFQGTVCMSVGQITMCQPLLMLGNMFGPYNPLRSGFWYPRVSENKWSLRKFKSFAHSYQWVKGQSWSADLLQWALEPSLLSLNHPIPQGRGTAHHCWDLLEEVLGDQPKEFRIHLGAATFSCW